MTQSASQLKETADRLRDELRGVMRENALAIPIVPCKDSSAPQNQGPGFQVNNFEVSQFIVNELNEVVGFWPYPPPELHLMVCAVCWLRPQLIVDWGTNVGNSARIFWQTTAKFEIPCEIHSVDLPEDIDYASNIKENRGILVKNLPRVSLHIGDGLDVALQIYRQHAPEVRSLFFLDGDHARASVLRELEGLSDAIPTAAMLVHDTHPSWGYNGPHQAVQEFLEAKPGKYEILSTGIGLPGMTFLYPKRLSVTVAG